MENHVFSISRLNFEKHWFCTCLDPYFARNETQFHQFYFAYRYRRARNLVSLKVVYAKEVYGFEVLDII